jgi:ATP-binding cassette subfamily G (WHITE) protein 2 (PDR)
MGVVKDQASTNTALSSSSESGSKHDMKSEEQNERTVLNLVREFTAQSAPFASPFDAAEGSPLDPKCDQFRAKAWAKAFYNLRYGSEESDPRVAGVSFTNLNVWGKGSPTDFQATVGNKILKLPSLFGRGAQKIEILQNLDGLLLPGEQLCVLGPPGYDFRIILPFKIANTGQFWLLYAVEDHLWRDTRLSNQLRLAAQLPGYFSRGYENCFSR